MSLVTDIEEFQGYCRIIGDQLAIRMPEGMDRGDYFDETYLDFIVITVEKYADILAHYETFYDPVSMEELYELLDGIVDMELCEYWVRLGQNKKASQ